jgi:alpha-glucosidase
MQKDFPDQRPFVLSRSGYAGSQSYGVGIWSADAPSRLKWLAAQPSMQLSLAMSGIPYWTSDIGGFGGQPVSSPKQFLRWLQFGLFSSLTRVHGNSTVGFNTERIIHPFQLPEPYKSLARMYVHWRYALIPYLYTAAREAFDTGLPITRALPLIYPDDVETFNLGSQYLLGPSLLVAPVVTGSDNDPALQRDIYLPSGEWIDIHDKTLYSGPKWLRNYPAPDWKLPLFVKKGAIIPKAEKSNFIGESSSESVRVLEIYPSALSTYVLYDDDGKSNQYTQKQIGRTRIEASQKSDVISIKISKMVGPFQSQIPQRMFKVELFSSADPKEIKWNGRNVPYTRNGKMIHFRGDVHATDKNQKFEVKY